MPRERILVQGDLINVGWTQHPWADNYAKNLEMRKIDFAKDVPVHGKIQIRAEELAASEATKKKRQEQNYESVDQPQSGSGTRRRHLCAGREDRTAKRYEGDGKPDVVRSNYSCGVAIELEQASKSLVTLNGVAALFGFVAGIWEKQLVAFTLMVVFAVIMRVELGQGPQRRARRTESTSTALLLSGPNPTFRKSV